jgi:protein-tyrosine phosphatase
MTAAGRHLDWEGCLNVRDLGGLPAADGRVTRWGAVVRSDSPAGLTPAGWAALRGHGIRTILDLRNDDERQGPAAPGAAGMAVVHVPLDDLADTAFWRRVWDEGLDGTPLYYRPFLERKPERCAAAVAAVADAGPGGVLVHCTVGRDRAGLVTLLLLALAGVAPDVIADDYELSNPRLEPLRARSSGAHRVGPGPAGSLARRGTTAREVILATLEAVDVGAVLRAGGLSDRRRRAVRDRLLEPPGPGPAAGRPRPTATRPGRRSGPSGR